MKAMPKSRRLVRELKSVLGLTKVTAEKFAPNSHSCRGGLDFFQFAAQKEGRKQKWGCAVANDNRDPINSTQHVLRSHYERVVEAGAWGIVLVVETDLELGPNLDHQAQMRVENLIAACQARVKKGVDGVQRIRLVKASR